MRLTLITGRTTGQGTSLEIGKTSEEYFQNVALALMNEADIAEIGAAEGRSVRVSTRSGSVVVRCGRSKLDRGFVFMPFGPWVSALMDADTHGTGMPDSKGLEVEVSATDEKVQTLEDILKLVR